MTKSFDSEIDSFPFTQEEWAFMMLSIYVYDEDYPEYKPLFDVDEFSPHKTTQEPKNLDEAKS